MRRKFCKPSLVRRSGNHAAIEIRASVSPPSRTSFPERAFGGIDLSSGGFFGSLVPCFQSHPNLSPGAHEPVYPELPLAFAEFRIRSPPQPPLDDKVAAVRGGEVLLRIRHGMRSALVSTDDCAHAAVITSVPARRLRSMRSTTCLASPLNAANCREFASRGTLSNTQRVPMALPREVTNGAPA